MRSTLLLTSVGDWAERFEAFVESGIPRDEFPGELPATYPEPVHCLPVPDDSGLDVDTLVGDTVLFDRDGGRYTWVARVTDVRSLPPATSRATDSGAERDTDPRPTGVVLVVGVPIPVSIDRRDLLDTIGAEEPRPFHRLTESEHDAIVDDYGSVQRFLLAHREEPVVWINTTPEATPEGSSWSPRVAERHVTVDDRSRDPRRGDIVVHHSADGHTVTGTSVVSALESRADGTAAVTVAEFQPLETPIDLVDDVLEEPSYRSRLNRIADTHGEVLYDDNREIVDEIRFTRCPPELLELFVAEAPVLLDHLRRWHYQVQRPAPADTYNSIEAALVDVRVRTAFDDRGPDWFADELLTTVVTHLTETLPRVQPDGDITPHQETNCELLRELFTQVESQVTTAASRLGIGSVQPLSEPETLFFVLLRDLQRAADGSEYLNPVSVRAILDEEYTVTTPRRPTPPPTGQPLDTAADPDNADDIARQLTATGQVVFYGPPGTGKTYTAGQFARWWLHQQSDVDPTTDQLETVTFHPSFTYEDFIEGLKADNTDDGVVYDYEAGVFKQFVESARDAYRTSTDTAPRYVMIIDEINRGNLAQIFGETITGLERDKRLDRPNETSVSLAHSGQPFTIPPNLYLIGTMNTADRSIALVDAALRRRFRFLSFPPDFDAVVEDDTTPFGSMDGVRAAAETPGHANRLLALSILAVQRFNETILATADLGKGKQIGHSFFFGKTTGPELADTWRFEILPLLEEYFYGQFGRIRDSLFAGGGHRLIDYESEEIRSFDAATLTAELARLLDVDG